MVKESSKRSLVVPFISNAVIRVFDEIKLLDAQTGASTIFEVNCDSLKFFTEGQSVLSGWAQYSC